MKEFDFASCVPFGRERSGVLLRAACARPAPAELVRRIEALLGLDGADLLRLEDRRRGHSRAIRQSRSGGEVRLEAMLLAGDGSAGTWLGTLLQDGLPAQAYGRLLLRPGAQPPVALAARSPQVCSCLDVSEDAIRQVLPDCAGSEQQRLEQLQGKLGCGTRCGSCLPALKRLTAAIPITDATHC
jgi:assimilatory nitrate reductase catalytic subunit